MAKKDELPPDPSVGGTAGLNAKITQGVVDVLKNPDLMPIEFKNWLPQFVDLNMLQHGYRHRNTGPDPIPIPNGVIYAYGGDNGNFGRAVSALSSDYTYIPIQIAATNDSSVFGVTTGSFGVAGLQIKKPGAYYISSYANHVAHDLHAITGLSASGPYKADMYTGSIFNVIGTSTGGRNINTNADFFYNENPTVSGRVHQILTCDYHAGFVYEPGNVVTTDGPPDDVIQFGIRSTIDDTTGPGAVSCHFLCLNLWTGTWNNADQNFEDLVYLPLP